MTNIMNYYNVLCNDYYTFMNSNRLTETYVKAHGLYH